MKLSFILLLCEIIVHLYFQISFKRTRRTFDFRSKKYQIGLNVKDQNVDSRSRRNSSLKNIKLVLMSRLKRSLKDRDQIEVRVVNGPGRASPAHFYLAHGHNELGIMGY